uniref:Uncharacterized protein n=1 Tax=Escherichia phage UFV-AREG1 TaxID=1837867 RepID=A0A173GAY1_9CAUD
MTHKNNIKSSVAEYYAKNGRSKEHVQNNINSRKSKKQVTKRTVLHPGPLTKQHGYILS